MDLKVFDIPLKVLDFTGAWISWESPRWDKIYSFILQISFVYGFTILMTNFGSITELNERYEQVSYFCTYLAFSLKSLNLLLQRGQIEKLLDDIKQCLENFEWNDSHRRQIDRAHLILKVFYVVTLLCVFYAGISAFFSDRLWYQMWIPFSLEEPEYYYLLAFYHFIGSIYAASGHVMLDMLLVLFLGYILSLLDHLSACLTNIDEKNDKLEELKRCIQYQLNIVELLRKIEGIFSTIWFIQGMFSTVVLCTIIYMLSTLTYPRELGTACSFLTYMLAMILQIFLPCYYGTKLQTAYDKMTGSLFYTNWMNESKEFKLNMKIFLENAKVSLKFVAFGTFKFDLEKFVTIFNSAYSLFNLLKSKN